ncbi:enoyl-CoA hydratase-related protein [Microbispora hainanensis]|uniref:enoyl-CoA hydratase-related protein n=1 Tax=Microbispora hainanensis TaxID=568844 RepID=UPI001ABF31BA|nr:enoyl-CoA hydratase-related protein [Microbispora hainanensis]
MNDAYTTLRVSREAGIARVTLDNPPVNVLDVVLMGDLRRLLATLRDDHSVRVVVFDSATRVLHRPRRHVAW